MHVNVFAMATPSPLFEGLWRHPEDRSATGYRSLDYWTTMARKLDDACVDALFFADYHGIFDMYQGSWKPAVRRGSSVPLIDPTLLLPAMAVTTEHLGFAVTYPTYNPPYDTARVFTTLDHLTCGRIAWNIVTSGLKSAYENGVGEFLEHDLRYDQADEYLTVVRKLWETSWEDGALRYDADDDTFADPEHVHQIDHHGKWYHVRGPFQCEPSPQRVPVLYQAGTSPRGTKFAAQQAEVLFLPLPNPDVGARIVADVRRQVAEQGRDPMSLKLLLSCTVLIGQDRVDADAKAETYVRLSSAEGILVRWCRWTDIDLASYPSEALVSEIPGFGGTQTFLDLLKKVDHQREWTIGDVRTLVSTVVRPGPAAPNILFGSPEQAADQMEHWLTATGVDGFNLMPCPPTTGVDDICDLLIPELQRRGMYRTEYDPAEQTLRERYFGSGARAFTTLN